MKSACVMGSCSSSHNAFEHLKLTNQKLRLSGWLTTKILNKTDRRRDKKQTHIKFGRATTTFLSSFSLHWVLVSPKSILSENKNTLTHYLSLFHVCVFVLCCWSAHLVNLRLSTRTIDRHRLLIWLLVVQLPRINTRNPHAFGFTQVCSLLERAQYFFDTLSSTRFKFHVWLLYILFSHSCRILDECK